MQRSTRSKRAVAALQPAALQPAAKKPDDAEWRKKLFYFSGTISSQEQVWKGTSVASVSNGMPSREDFKASTDTFEYTLAHHEDTCRRMRTGAIDTRDDALHGQWTSGFKFDDSAPTAAAPDFPGSRIHMIKSHLVRSVHFEGPMGTLQACGACGTSEGLGAFIEMGFLFGTRDPYTDQLVMVRRYVADDDPRTFRLGDTIGKHGHGATCWDVMNAIGFYMQFQYNRFAITHHDALTSHKSANKVLEERMLDLLPYEGDLFREPPFLCIDPMCNCDKCLMKSADEFHAHVKLVQKPTRKRKDPCLT